MSQKKFNQREASLLSKSQTPPQRGHHIISPPHAQMAKHTSDNRVKASTVSIHLKRLKPTSMHLGSTNGEQRSKKLRRLEIEPAMSTSRTSNSTYADPRNYVLTTEAIESQEPRTSSSPPKPPPFKEGTLANRLGSADQNFTSTGATQEIQDGGPPAELTSATVKGVESCQIPHRNLLPCPDPESCPCDMDPDTFFHLVVQSQLGFEPKVQRALSLHGFFPEISDDQLVAYGIEVVSATRENDLPALRVMHGSGQSLHCCNRFGESLLHMACRRGFTEIVRFFLEEVRLPVRIRDDCGRTPLHDACWNRNAKFEIVDMLVREDPALLLVSDKRGYTPFSYARREHWSKWRKFLHERRSYLDSMDPSLQKIFGTDS